MGSLLGLPASVKTCSLVLWGELGICNGVGRGQEWEPPPSPHSSRGRESLCPLILGQGRWETQDECLHPAIRQTGVPLETHRAGGAGPLCATWLCLPRWVGGLHLGPVSQS